VTLRIVAIVPTLDEAANVSDAVAALRREVDAVVVADGGSRDTTVALARAAGAQVVESARGYAEQCQAAVASHPADVYLFVAADSRVGIGAGAAIRQALVPEAVTYGGFWLRIDDVHLVFRYVEFGGNFRAYRHRLALSDQGLFVRASALKAAGGMQPSSIPHALLCDRLSRQGEFRLLGPATVTSSRKWHQYGFRNVARAHGHAYRAFRAQSKKGHTRV